MLLNTPFVQPKKGFYCIWEEAWFFRLGWTERKKENLKKRDQGKRQGQINEKKRKVEKERNGGSRRNRLKPSNNDIQPRKKQQLGK